MELPGSDEMARNFVGSTETTAAVELMTESDQLRAEVRRLRLHCERLEEVLLYIALCIISMQYTRIIV